ncbi:MAG: FAD-dependent tricarballylate dehydrogenase TcuA [Alphaproteobacteria bacterium]|nr:MAG: Fumarate reductase flavoprotein subunit [Alphaproteobacteria bacterium MarineAlpha9_Bin5]HIA21065.1 FAD-binding dehydrogenase [Alphaproteobacteria bacterium]HIB18637.1 FAD-binding dehydrogenase [Alphaproteobacteria bacterium]HIB55468.1 FAD-binding dehydrogenase [Alphaproteobacteria bacterium]HIM72674.1 FAD-binding dehydrogenase [Alphaproteobacteria bacterium]
MSNRKVVVVGAGNAGLCAAIAAREQGASVVVLECAPEEERGGNSRFTAGAVRVAYEGVEELKALMPDLSAQEIETTDFGTYTQDEFFDDMARVTEYRSDPDLVDLLVKRSMTTLLWMRDKGVRFVPIYGRQAFKVDGRFKFWGGLTVEAWGGGPGLVDALFSAARKAGIEVFYGTRAVKLTQDNSGVNGVRVRRDGKTFDIKANAVVLASGGFEANTEWRTRYLGPGWDLAKVRGSRFNTGGGIKIALDAGAMPYGNWSGCHAVGWDRNAPDFGDLAVGDGFQKHSYPFGIMINANGERFVDEGADFRNYTYAKYGSEVLKQPGQFAWQIFDSQVAHLLRDEYRIREVTKVTAENLEDLVGKLDGVNSSRARMTVDAYNAAVSTEIDFNPNIKDGRGTVGLSVPKSNWANRIDQPPFSAYAVTCGITFTFGGLRVDNQAHVLDMEQAPIAGLYAAGELVGGLFYFNYPGGTGLTSGAVFGRIAGVSSGQFAIGEDTGNSVS